MTARFAGSRNLDERRRRRLATGPDEVQVSFRSVSLRPALNAALPQQASDSPRLASDRFPLHKLVSHRVWKNLAVAMMVALVGAGLIWCGWQVSRKQLQVGPSAAAFLAIHEGTAIRSFGASLLLLSSQLAYVISWARSRSPRDFAGRYRVWSWTAAVWMLFAFCAATDAHHVACDTVFWFWDFALWKRDVLGWLVPGYVIVLCLMWPLHRDMLDCRGSLIMLGLACIAAMFVAISALRLVADPEGLLSVIAPLVAQYFIFVSMLLHARHVIHVSCDPPSRLRVRTMSVPWWKRRLVKDPVAETTDREADSLETDCAAEDSSKPVVQTEDVEKSDAAVKPPTSKNKPRRRVRSGNSAAAEPSTTTSSSADRSTRTTAGSPDAGVAQAVTSPGTESSSSTIKDDADADSRNRIDAESKPDEGTRSEPTADQVADPFVDHEPISGDVGGGDQTQDRGSSRQFRIDAAAEEVEPHIDPSELKGLTKKQRRALRKQRREQARSGH